MPKYMVHDLKYMKYAPFFTKKARFPNFPSTPKIFPKILLQQETEKLSLTPSNLPDYKTKGIITRSDKKNTGCGNTAHGISTTSLAPCQNSLMNINYSKKINTYVNDCLQRFFIYLSQFFKL